MLLVTGLILLGLGIAVWLYGNRMWLQGPAPARCWAWPC